MASAQVPPNPEVASVRKQGHLEAGKRRLEEFRRKKAARKAPPGGLLPSNDEVPDRPANGTITFQSNSDRSVGELVEPLSSSVYYSKNGNSSHVYEGDSVNGIHNASCDGNQLGDSDLNSEKDECHMVQESSHVAQLTNDLVGIHQGRSNMSETRKVDLVSLEVQTDFDPVQADSTDNTNAKFYPQSVSNSNNIGIFEKYSRRFGIADTSSSSNLVEDAGSCPELVTGVISSSFSDALPGDELSVPSKLDEELHSDTARGTISNTITRRFNIEETVMPEYSSMDSTFGRNGSSIQRNQYSFLSKSQGNFSGRSRPSFLDSINVSSALDLPADSLEVEQASSHLTPYNRQVQQTSSLPSVNIDTEEPSANSHKNANDDVKSASYHGDDFAALEQHIEDLTREKFSLQRELHISRSLAESLASENSSLTESYNQQGEVVVQLKFDMERLQDEVQAHLRAFELLQLEFTNAQQECKAADERAKILASEVINLEEKSLRLRSSELKLEKQLENANSDIASYRQKMLSFKKEKDDFLSTIEVLQEEKKLLQSKLRNAPMPGGNLSMKRDACTSTSDVDSSYLTNPDEVRGLASMPAIDSSTSSFDVSKIIVRHETIGSFPPDHLGMIDNINSLISELALEKGTLMKALSAEVSMNSKLMDINKELSMKLDSQTQRFELLAAQKMSIDVVPMKRATSGRIIEPMQYTDEGDEVVERVLGWIMKLFPRGPGKRMGRRLS